MQYLKLLSLAVIFSSFSATATDAGHNHSTAAKKDVVDSFEEHVRQVKEFETSDKFKPDILSTPQPFDVSIGDPNAKVKIVEYASLSCSHCKQFHSDVFYPLKREYIDSGKVHFTYRHYPLNAPALKAAVVMQCIGKDNELAFMGSLFEAQSQWAYVKSEADLMDKLKTISKIAGLSGKEFNECYKNDAVQAQILANMKDAHDGLLVTSTPTIFVDGKRFLESREFEGYAKHIDSLLKAE